MTMDLICSALWCFFKDISRTRQTHLLRHLARHTWQMITISMTGSNIFYFLFSSGINLRVATQVWIWWIWIGLSKSPEIAYSLFLNVFKSQGKVPNYRNYLWGSCPKRGINSMIYSWRSNMGPSKVWISSASWHITLQQIAPAKKIVNKRIASVYFISPSNLFIFVFLIIYQMSKISSHY